MGTGWDTVGFRIAAISVSGTLTSGDTLILSRVDTVSEAVPESGSYADWASDHGLASGSMLDESPAADGIRNLMKYGLGIEPAVAGWQGRMEKGRMEDSGTNFFMLRYVRPEPAPADVSYAVQAAGSLQAADWTDGVVVSSAVSNGLRTITVRDPLPMTGNTNRFIRLRVTK